MLAQSSVKIGLASLILTLFRCKCLQPLIFAWKSGSLLSSLPPDLKDYHRCFRTHCIIVRRYGRKWKLCLNMKPIVSCIIFKREFGSWAQPSLISTSRYEGWHEKFHRWVQLLWENVSKRFWICYQQYRVWYSIEFGSWSHNKHAVTGRSLHCPSWCEYDSINVITENVHFGVVCWAEAEPLQARMVEQEVEQAAGKGKWKPRRYYGHRGL